MCPQHSHVPDIDQIFVANSWRIEGIFDNAIYNVLQVHDPNPLLAFNNFIFFILLCGQCYKNVVFCLPDSHPSAHMKGKVLHCFPSLCSVFIYVYAANANFHRNFLSFFHSRVWETTRFDCTIFLQISPFLKSLHLFTFSRWLSHLIMLRTFGFD